MASKVARKKKRSSRVHAVKAQLTVEELAKARSALFLEIHGRDGKLGDLEIGRGSLFWTGGGRQKSKRIGWPRFAEMMDRLAYGED